MPGHHAMAHLRCGVECGRGFSDLCQLVTETLVIAARSRGCAAEPGLFRGRKYTTSASSSSSRSRPARLHSQRSARPFSRSRILSETRDRDRPGLANVLVMTLLASWSEPCDSCCGARRVRPPARYRGHTRTCSAAEVADQPRLDKPAEVEMTYVGNGMRGRRRPRRVFHHQDCRVAARTAPGAAAGNRTAPTRSPARVEHVGQGQADPIPSF